MPTTTTTTKATVDDKRLGDKRTAWQLSKIADIRYKFVEVGKHRQYGHLPPITKTIQVRRTWHAGHCWRGRDELISDVLLWTPTYSRTKAGRPARTYIQQLCEDMGCSPEDLSEAMNDREKWRERVRDIRASGTIWWWWYMRVLFYVYTEENVFIYKNGCTYLWALIYLSLF